MNLFLLVLTLVLSPISYSQVPAEADLLIDTGFNTSVWYLDDWLGGDTYRTISLPTALAGVVKDPTNADNKVLQWNILKGTHAGARFLSKKIGRSEVWASYRIYIPEEFGNYDLGSDSDDASKLPGPSGGGEGSGAQVESTGANGWSARVGWKVDPVTNEFKIGYYTYHADRLTKWGDWMGWSKSLQRGRWYTITQHIRVNSLGPTKGKNDGVLEAYLDGELVFSNEKLRFTDIPDFSQVAHYWLTFYFGGTSTAPKNLHIFLDDVKVYGMPEPPPAVITKVFPNPKVAVGEPLHVDMKVNKAGPYSFQMVDIDGRVLFQTENIFLNEGDASISVPTDSCLPGIHILYSNFGSFISREGLGSAQITPKRIVIAE